MITQSALKELLHYDPETGIFTWNVSVTPAITPGDIAGHVYPNGHRMIAVRRRKYPAQHLAFLYMTGSLPRLRVIHWNDAFDDNRWSNLHEATDSQINHRKGCRNPIAPGVSRKASGRFEAGLKVNGTYVLLGRFDTADEASSARDALARERFGAFAHVSPRQPGGGSILCKYRGDRRGEVSARAAQIGVFPS